MAKAWLRASKHDATRIQSELESKCGTNLIVVEIFRAQTHAVAACAQGRSTHSGERSRPTEGEPGPKEARGCSSSIDRHRVLTAREETRCKRGSKTSSRYQATASS
jgi:hypothetical protein